VPRRDPLAAPSGRLPGGSRRRTGCRDAPARRGWPGPALRGLVAQPDHPEGAAVRPGRPTSLELARRDRNVRTSRVATLGRCDEASDSLVAGRVARLVGPGRGLLARDVDGG
jgi:hypothetical protein